MCVYASVVGVVFDRAVAGAVLLSDLADREVVELSGGDGRLGPDAQANCPRVRDSAQVELGLVGPVDEQPSPRALGDHADLVLRVRIRLDVGREGLLDCLPLFCAFRRNEVKPTPGTTDGYHMSLWGHSARQLSIGCLAYEETGTPKVVARDVRNSEGC